MDRDVTFCHLLGILKEFYAKMGFEECASGRDTSPTLSPQWSGGVHRWSGLGGAGRSGGLPKRGDCALRHRASRPGLGAGVSRVAMLRLGLKDLRLLYQSDLEWLRQTPVCIKL